MVRQKSALLLLVPALLFYTLFTAYPYIISLYYSFTDWLGSGPMHFIGVDNYRRLFTDPRLAPQFWRAFLHNLFFLGMSMVFVVTIGLAFAFMLASKKLRGVPFFKAVYFLPFVLSPLALGFIWRYMLNPQVGTVNELLGIVGLGSWAQPWLGSTKFTLPIVALVWCSKQTGLYILFFLAAIIGIPDDFRDAAKIDGCSRWQQILYIELPLLKPTFITLTVLNIINSFAAFDLVFALTGIEGAPAGTTDILTAFFYRTAFGTQAEPFGLGIGMGSAVAWAIVIFLIITSLLFLWVRQRSYVEY